MFFQFQHFRHLVSFASPKNYFHSILFLYRFGPGHNFYASVVLTKIIWEAGDLENLWLFFLLPVPALGTLPGVQMVCDSSFQSCPRLAEVMQLHL